MPELKKGRMNRSFVVVNDAAIVQNHIGVFMLKGAQHARDLILEPNVVLVAEEYVVIFAVLEGVLEVFNGAFRRPSKNLNAAIADSQIGDNPVGVVRAFVVGNYNFVAATELF